MHPKESIEAGCCEWCQIFLLGFPSSEISYTLLKKDSATFVQLNLLSAKSLSQTLFSYSSICAKLCLQGQAEINTSHQRFTVSVKLEGILRASSWQPPATALSRASAFFILFPPQRLCLQTFRGTGKLLALPSHCRLPNAIICKLPP